VSASAIDAQSYQGLRPYLFAVAYRMTGSASDAEDLVHDAWVRYLDAGEPAVDSLRAYLTTIVSRLSLDYLKSARVQREQYTGTWMPEPVLTAESANGPAETVEQREAVSLALLTLLERLTPEQRVVYVLREGFGLPYDEIAGHLGKTTVACRQLFSRAQKQLDGQRRTAVIPTAQAQQLLERFLEAFGRGDAAGVARVLTEDVVWAADAGPHRLANRRSIRGRDRVARGLAGLAAKVRPDQQLSTKFVDLNGALAIAVFEGDDLERVFAFDTTPDAQIATVRVLMNPNKLRHLAESLGTRPVQDSPYALPRTAKIAPVAS
jgi:RNA polymerase sigma-70 factor (ECF subfamily)